MYILLDNTIYKPLSSPTSRQFTCNWPISRALPSTQGDWLMSHTTRKYLFHMKACAVIEDSDQTARKCSLIWDFNVCMRHLFIFSCSWSLWQRLLYTGRSNSSLVGCTGCEWGFLPMQPLICLWSTYIRLIYWSSCPAPWATTDHHFVLVGPEE